MPGKKAKENYIKKRMNCALAVADALKDRAGLSDYALDQHSGHGSGNAPGSWCGGVYAASQILEKSGNKDKIPELEAEFIRLAGSLKCSEIRKNRKLSCVGCVEKAAELVDKLLK